MSEETYKFLCESNGQLYELSFYKLCQSEFLRQLVYTKVGTDKDADTGAFIIRHSSPNLAIIFEHLTSRKPIPFKMPRNPKELLENDQLFHDLEYFGIKCLEWRSQFYLSRNYKVQLINERNDLPVIVNFITQFLTELIECDPSISSESGPIVFILALICEWYMPEKSKSKLLFRIDGHSKHDRIISFGNVPQEMIWLVDLLWTPHTQLRLVDLLLPRLEESFKVKAYHMKNDEEFPSTESQGSGVKYNSRCAIKLKLFFKPEGAVNGLHNSPNQSIV